MTEIYLNNYTLPVLCTTQENRDLNVYRGAPASRFLQSCDGAMIPERFQASAAYALIQSVLLRVFGLSSSSARGGFRCSSVQDSEKGSSSDGKQHGFTNAIDRAQRLFDQRITL